MSEDLPPRKSEPHQRILSGRFELAPLLDKCREVRGVCFPDRGFIRLKVAGYYATYGAPERYSLVALDTNAHGYDLRGYKTAGRFKSGSSYKRPSHDLCEPSHVPVCWGYRGLEGDSLFASLSGGAVVEALGELEARCGERPLAIEVRVQMVWLKPDDADSKRALMSWALPVIRRRSNGCVVKLDESLRRGSG